MLPIWHSSTQAQVGFSISLTIKRYYTAMTMSTFGIISKLNNVQDKPIKWLNDGMSDCLGAWLTCFCVSEWMNECMNECMSGEWWAISDWLTQCVKIT